jgi:transcriptional regulator with XRE-family HTH domain
MSAQSPNPTNLSKKIVAQDASSTSITDPLPTELIVGMKIRDLRIRRNYSLRMLSERSRLNINTLSLIENGKSSPSVGTLHQLSLALEVPITAFFESEPVSKRVVFTSAENRPLAAFGSTRMENLGKNLSDSAVQPFVVTLVPGKGSGERIIFHTGHEFVYCLSGSIQYYIEKKEYILKPGDSLVFEALLPHCWKNNGNITAQILLVLYPSDKREEPGGRHFSNDTH